MTDERSIYAPVAWKQDGSPVMAHVVCSERYSSSILRAIARYLNFTADLFDTPIEDGMPQPTSIAPMPACHCTTPPATPDAGGETG